MLGIVNYSDSESDNDDLDISEEIKNDKNAFKDDIQTSVNDVQTTINDAKTSENDVQTTINDVKTSENDAKTSINDDKTFENDDQTSKNDSNDRSKADQRKELTQQKSVERNIVLEGQEDMKDLPKYLNDESELEENTGSILKRKAISSSDDDSSDEEKHNHNEQKLPLPSIFGKSKPTKDERHKHEGRKRTFDHFEGNWATYVYIPVQESTSFITLYERVTKQLQNKYGNVIRTFPKNSCHVTISKTVPIRHYWMTPLFEKLKHTIACKRKFFFTLASVKVYTNDDRSRTFVGIDISTGHEKFSDFVQNVDKIFQEFNLDKYYECPSFHGSIAWCLGDKKEKFEQFFEERGPTIMAGFPGGIAHQLADKVCMKSGNKIFQIILE